MFINIYFIYNTSCKHKPVKDIKSIPRRQHSNPPPLLLPNRSEIPQIRNCIDIYQLLSSGTERKHGKIRVTLRTLTTQSVQYSININLHVV